MLYPVFRRPINLPPGHIGVDPTTVQTILVQGGPAAAVAFVVCTINAALVVTILRMGQARQEEWLARLDQHTAAVHAVAKAMRRQTRQMGAVTRSVADACAAKQFFRPDQRGDKK